MPLVNNTIISSFHQAIRADEEERKKKLKEALAQLMRTAAEDPPGYTWPNYQGAPPLSESELAAKAEEERIAQENANIMATGKNLPEWMIGSIEDYDTSSSDPREYLIKRKPGVGAEQMKLLVEHMQKRRQGQDPGFDPVFFSTKQSQDAHKQQMRNLRERLKPILEKRAAEKKERMARVTQHAMARSAGMSDPQYALFDQAKRGKELDLTLKRDAIERIRSGNASPTDYQLAGMDPSYHPDILRAKVINSLGPEATQEQIDHALERAGLGRGNAAQEPPAPPAQGLIQGEEGSVRTREEVVHEIGSDVRKAPAALAAELQEVDRLYPDAKQTPKEEYIRHIVSQWPAYGPYASTAIDAFESGGRTDAERKRAAISRGLSPEVTEYLYGVWVARKKQADDDFRRRLRNATRSRRYSGFSPFLGPR